MSFAHDCVLSETLSALDCVETLYTNTTLRTLEVIHSDVERGADPDSILPDKGADWVMKAYEESKRTNRLADGWLAMNDREVLDLPFDGLDDYSLACLAWHLMERTPEDLSLNEAMHERSNQALLACLGPREGSVLLDYEWIFEDLLGYSAVKDREEHIALYERSLAHSLRHSSGYKARSILANLASDLATGGEMERASNIFCELLRHDPTDFELYYDMSFAFANARLQGLANRAVELAASSCASGRGDAHILEDLKFTIYSQRASQIEQEARNTSWYQELWATMNTPHEAQGGNPVDDLCRRLVPTIDEIPVKAIPFVEVQLTGRIPETTPPLERPKIGADAVREKVSPYVGLRAVVKEPGSRRCVKTDPSKKKKRKASKKSRRKNR